MRTNTMAIFVLFGGVFFTVFSVIAWTTGKRVAAMALAILAGVDIALAVQLLQRYYSK
jgi:Zn-dependent protease with chaperone function